jgi:hypothetical protein
VGYLFHRNWKTVSGVCVISPLFFLLFIDDDGGDDDDDNNIFCNNLSLFFLLPHNKNVDIM